MTTAYHSSIKHDATKHEAILNQAISLFAADGFARGDVQAIADAAGVGKGTVYRYFGNKLDLFHACTFAVSKRVDERISAAISESASPLENIRAACMAYAEFFEASPEYLELLVQERAEFRGVKPELHHQYHNKMIDGFAAILQQAVDAGEIRPVDARKTVIALANLLFGNVVHTCCFSFPEGKEETPTSLTEFAVDMFTRGLRKSPPPDVESGKDQGGSQ